jgi:hypothetical protein
MKNDPLQELEKREDEKVFGEVLCINIFLETSKMHCVGHFIMLMITKTLT